MFSSGEQRPKYNAYVLKERYEKETRFFRIHDIFKPSLKGKVISGKFYSPHDTLDLSFADPELVEKIRLYQEGMPKEKYLAPLSVNHSYGWYSLQLFVPLNKGDRRYYSPNVASISKLAFAMKRK